MADISIIIKGKDTNDKTSTTSVTYVNAQTTDNYMYQLGQKIFSFTTLTDPIIIKQTQEILTAGGE